MTDTTQQDGGGIVILEAGHSPQLERHPLSAAWGDMPEDALPDFDSEVESAGVISPIDLFEGMVLDGWHRYQASIRVNVTCPTVEFNGSPEAAADHAIRRNLHRRHLTSLDAAKAALRCFDDIIARGGDRRTKTFRERQRITLEEVAKKIGVSAATVARARRDLREEDGLPAHKSTKKEPDNAETKPRPQAPTPASASGNHAHPDPPSRPAKKGATAEAATDPHDAPGSASDKSGSANSVKELARLRERVTFLESQLAAEQEAHAETRKALAAQQKATPHNLTRRLEQSVAREKRLREESKAKITRLQAERRDAMRDYRKAAGDAERHEKKNIELREAVKAAESEIDALLAEKRQLTKELSKK